MSAQRHAVPLSLIIADSAKLVASEQFAAEVPSLARLAGRGVVREVELTRRQRAWTAAEFSILEACGLLENIERFPSGAVSAVSAVAIQHAGEDRAQDERLDETCWAHADGVHFSAGLNDLAGLQLRGHAGIMDEEHAALSESLRAHLGVDCELHSLRPGNWLLKFPRVLDAQTQAPQHAFRGPLQDALPSGLDGAQLRRLMTELQMVLHDTAVNDARARRGVPAINAIWIWGLGAMPAAQSVFELPGALGSSAFLKGLYRVHNETVAADPSTFDALLKQHAREQPLLAVIDDSEPADLQSRWFAPLERALRAGRITRAAIHFDRWRILVKRADLLRLWRTDWHPPEQSA